MTQKITFRGRGKYQDKIDASNAARLGNANPFVAGVQAVVDGGFGHPIKDSRTAYGAPRHMPQELLQGKSSNFAQADAPANAPQDDPLNQTGDLALGTAATRQPNRDQEALNTERLEQKLALYRGTMGNAHDSLNPRQNIGRLA